jgi:hypothetical protein
MPRNKLFAGLVCAASIGFLRVSAQTIDPAYSDKYTATDLGQVPVFNQNGNGGSIAAIVFKDPNTLYMAVNDDGAAGEIDSVHVIRDSNNHITGFSNPAWVANTPYIDGGMQFAPNGVLLYTIYSSSPSTYNKLGELKPGSTSPDKEFSLTPLGISPSVGSLAFVPDGMAGAGSFKLTSWNAQTWYEATLTSDGSGLYNVSSVGASVPLPHYTEGIGYVRAGNAHFPFDSVILAADYGTLANALYSYQVDSNGNPITSTRHTFASIDNPYGITFDPITGDMLVSTEVGHPNTFEHITLIQGFDPVPEPKAATMVSALALLALGVFYRLKVKRA